MTDHWKISDFANQLGKHANTVDTWFKKLENQRIHYVNRVNQEKVYDTLDYEIGLFIRQKREEKWTLEGIFNVLGNHFTLRPFPLDDEFPETNELNVGALKRELTQEIQDSLERIAATQENRLEHKMESILKRLSSEPSQEEIEAARIQKRQEKVNEILTRRKVERKLEQEALELWNQKPEEERLIRTGLFRKEENVEKKQEFIKKHIDNHFESELLEAFGLDE
ncbi:MerR family transcriptional regulator [Bacillus piscicola]|uniref:MerR family transcriptional regulator n=1 Tax=Bacillus piscicola TaxID=1632684 RepID=UPI001F090F01|nr:MerR family transcriptional regulator [Bacillus piscicola]